MRVKELYIYPVKSMGGIKVAKALAMKAGFEHDRRWMLIDRENKFVTQRQLPQLALFKTNIADNHLTISYESHEFAIGLDETDTEVINTQVWDDEAKVKRVNQLADEWLSDMLKTKLGIVKIYDEKSRNHHNKTHDICLPVSLADGYPYLVAGTESLNHLNSQLSQPIDMSRFRPNIVIETQTPHEEDHWTYCKMGELVFQNLKPCGRCQIITIDQKTAVINNEPLKVLNQYRKASNSVLFGTNMVCESEGMLYEGNDISFF